MSNINVNSEYKTLKKVLVHRPGEETENLTPSTYEELLFDDSYYLPNAQKEHDMFVKAMTDNGVEVVYLEDLVAETLDISPEIKANFLKEFVHEAKVDPDSKIFPIIIDFFNSFNTTKEMVVKAMAGVRYSELGLNGEEITSLVEVAAKDELFVLKPMPNLIFTRDPFSTIGNGISLHTMHFETRKRETLFSEYVFKFHPEYKDTKQYYNRNRSTSLEGGDVMILKEDEIAVGISQRSEAASHEKLAAGIFGDPDSKIKTIWAINIPKGRSWMHLDTVFTQIDVDKFSVFTDYDFNIFKITKTEGINYTIEEFNSSIADLMGRIFNNQATLIYCGDNDPLVREREQWNDGSNVLALRPGVIITYDRNYITNQTLRSHGVEVIEINSGELSRGRGGPRCMSMPLVRED